MSNTLADSIIANMKAADLRYIVTVPDSTTRSLQRVWRSDPYFRVVPACHEGEAIAVGCGLWIAGRRAMVVMENAGLFQAGETLRAMAIDMQIPLVMGVSYLARPQPNMSLDAMIEKEEKHVGGPATHKVQQGWMTEPWLRFWNVPYVVVDAPEGAAAVQWAVTKAVEVKGPVALIFDQAVGDFR